MEALEKAYAAGCRSPIALFIDARNLALTGNNYGTNVERFRLALARAAGKPELDFIRFYCANLQGWDYKSRGAYKEAVESFELALSIRAPEVDEQIRKEAESGLQQAKEQLAVQQEQSAHLAALTLPPHPTKEQARAYARQVLLQAAQRSAPAWNDPAIAMLEKVGPENLDVLLELWGTTVTSSPADIDRSQRRGGGREGPGAARAQGLAAEMVAPRGIPCRSHAAPGMDSGDAPIPRGAHCGALTRIRTWESCTLPPHCAIRPPMMTSSGTLRTTRTASIFTTTSKTCPAFS